ncbi:MAG TPA: Gfo/Idh/MocA family oxidoreductase [Prolixibacteraceae bacterium]|nr:Gfo/Idh/MocA family oxidoreductase [Prolixibacteraceae bacterium]
MKKEVLWGVIGSGGIARRRTIPEGILPAKNGRLISVFDIGREVNEAVANQFNAVASQTIEELLQSGIDAVYIATPVNVHLEQVILAAQAGKHIFCEKPLGLTIQEAEEMGAVCKKEGVYLGTAYMMRFAAQHQAALEMIQQGKLGKPVYGRAQLSCWYPPISGAWRQDPATSGGGALMDMGSHCIDLLEMFFGEVSAVSCMIRNSVHDYPSEDSAIVFLVFKNGAMGTVDSFFCIPDNSSKNILELYGSKGSILASGTIGQEPSGEMKAWLDDDNVAYDANQKRSAAKGLIINPIPTNTYLAEIEEFSSAILDNREPLNNFGKGLHSQKVLAACYESARTGRTINIL